MTFDEAEAKFRDLRARIHQGVPIGRAELEDRVAQMAVLDGSGRTWQIHPRTGRWMRFDGLEWVYASPPGRESLVAASAVEVDPAPGAQSASADTKEGRLDKVSQVNNELRALKPAPRNRIAPRILRSPPPVSIAADWIPFGGGGICLILAAALVFFGGRTLQGSLFPSPSSTQVKSAQSGMIAARSPSPTRVALFTLIPPSTPSPMAASVTATVTEARVNVRAAPNTRANVVGKIKKDDVITLVGRNEESTWYQVAIPGITPPSWVFGQTLKVTNGDPRLLPVSRP